MCFKCTSLVRLPAGLTSKGCNGALTLAIRIVVTNEVAVTSARYLVGVHRFGIVEATEWPINDFDATYVAIWTRERFDAEAGSAQPSHVGSQECKY